MRLSISAARPCALRFFIAAGLCLGGVPPIAAADSGGGLSGTVVDTHNQPIAGVKVQLKNTSGRVISQTVSSSAGAYAFTDLPPGSYGLSAATADGSAQTDVEVSAGVTRESELSIGAVALDTVVVTAHRLERARNELSPSTGSSQYSFNEGTIDRLPEGDHTPFNRLLLQAPGVANDSYGQLHVRGDHGDLQYRFNGIILPEGVSGFGQVLDPRFAKSITLNTGALPAQYGLRTAGVVDIVTKDSVDGGTVDLYGGSHDTLNPSFQYGQTSGPFSAYVTGQYLSSGLGVENSTDSRNPIHDDTRQAKGFGYFSYVLDSQTKLSTIVASTYSRLEIPNNPDQPVNCDYVNQLNGNTACDSNAAPTTAQIGDALISSRNLDERQYEHNLYGIVALQGVGEGDLTYQLAAFDRQSSVTFEPDAIGDLVFNGDASNVGRKSTTAGVQGDISHPLGESHRISAGFSASTENDVADNTSTLFTVDADGNVNGGPVTIVDNNRKNGNTLASVYAQDQWAASDSLIINYGLRYDRLDAFAKGSQLSPRIGLIDYLTSRTTLHAGYARYFTPPPNELVTSTSIAKFAGTVNAPEVTENSPVKPERSHYFDAGLTHQLTSALNVGVDAYYRIARDLLDEGQFGQALIFTPFNYAKGRVYGIELTSAYHSGNFSAYGNLARAKAQATQVSSGQFNFGQDELDYIATHYVYLDHDQRLTASAGLSYRWIETTFGVEGTYGSGLREGFANTGELPYNLQFDLSASRTLHISDSFGNLEVRTAVLNVLDRKNEIRDGSGIGVGAPQFGPRAALYFGVTKPFGGI